MWCSGTRMGAEPVRASEAAVSVVGVGAVGACPGAGVALSGR